MSERVEISIAVDDEHGGRIHEVAGALRKIGVEISTELEEVGVILGSVSRDKLADVQRTIGVRSAEIVGEVTTQR
jgi:hypothetical protein